VKAGITGLPYSGKTMLFCALTGQRYDTLSRGKDIHVGSVKVPDSRLERLYEMFRPKKITHAVMEYFDVAGQAPVQGKTMEPQVMQTLKNADSLIVVLDAFSDGAKPERDLDEVMGDFGLGDLVVLTGRLERIERDLRSGKSDILLAERAVLERCREKLESGGALRELEFGEEELKLIRGYQFLSLKPLLIVVNISESDLSSGKAADFEGRFTSVGDAACAAICVEVEMEIAALEESDRPEFLSSMGIEEPALGRLIRMSYDSQGLISFFTAGGTDEVRAWTVRKGARAPECAGVIHSDLERGFIRAETVSFDDLMETGSFKAAREKGVLRIEGKDYVVKDGDILTIRFSV
jgi:ribosome-binding ATPase